MQINNVEDLKKVMEEAFPTLTWEVLTAIGVTSSGNIRATVTSKVFGDYCVSLHLSGLNEVNVSATHKDPVEALKLAKEEVLLNLQAAREIVESI